MVQQHSFRTCSIQFKSKDYYKLLGVSKTSSDTDIKKAYVELAKNCHPDVNKDDPKANEKFQEITKAYEYILYENKRNLLSLHQNKNKTYRTCVLYAFKDPKTNEKFVFSNVTVEKST